ncbi:MAG: hypothetical protein IH851_08250 [Armatimonadetes bacterium]|nr:hypothetical protein [Armatimonadota bacterium]
MRLKHVAIVVAAVGAMPLLQGGGILQGEGGGTKIAFMSRRDKGNAEIHIMNANGTGPMVVRPAQEPALTLPPIYLMGSLIEPTLEWPAPGLRGPMNVTVRVRTRWSAQRFNGASLKILEPGEPAFAHVEREIEKIRDGELVVRVSARTSDGRARSYDVKGIRFDFRGNVVVWPLSVSAIYDDALTWTVGLPVVRPADDPWALLKLRFLDERTPMARIIELGLAPVLRTDTYLEAQGRDGERYTFKLYAPTVQGYRTWTREGYSDAVYPLEAAMPSVETDELLKKAGHYWVRSLKRSWVPTGGSVPIYEPPDGWSMTQKRGAVTFAASVRTSAYGMTSGYRLDEKFPAHRLAGVSGQVQTDGVTQRNPAVIVVRLASGRILSRDDRFLQDFVYPSHDPPVGILYYDSHHYFEVSIPRHGGVLERFSTGSISDPATISLLKDFYTERPPLGSSDSGSSRPPEPASHHKRRRKNENGRGDRI